ELRAVVRDDLFGQGRSLCDQHFLFLSEHPLFDARALRLSVPGGVNDWMELARVRARAKRRAVGRQDVRRPSPLAATTLGRAAAVVCLRSDVLDGGHLEASSRQRANCGVAT